MDRQAQRDIRRKLNCLRFAQERGSNVLACRKFGVSKSSFYRWKALYREKGEAGLINSKPCPENPALRTPTRIEEKILHLRRRYHFGPDRIAWYLERYHQIKISGKGVETAAATGDLLATLHIAVPTALSDAESAAIDDLRAAEVDWDPRSYLGV